MPERILIVDDEQAVSEMLGRTVSSMGMIPVIANNGEESLEILDKEDFDLCLMDINMPGIDGFEVIRKIREDGKRIPIIIVSDRRDEKDELYGLEIGADEYVVKPFNPITLSARIKAVIRRSKGEYSGDDIMLSAGPFEYNTSTLRLFKNGTEIPLSGKENALMKLFLDNPNRIYSKDMLYELIWANEVFDDNVIMVYINRLRNKIEDDPGSPKFIKNIRKVGYKFVIE